MVKIKFIGGTDLTSKGIHFINGGVYEVSPEVAEYLNKTFGNIEIIEAESKPKGESKVEPKAGTKVVPDKK